LKGKRNELLSKLRTLDMLKNSDKKSIPEQYMFGSVAQRLALLQGLVDNDGTVAKDGFVEYNTTSKALANQVVDLVRSLGGTSRLRTRIPTYEYKGKKLKGLEDNRIGIKLPPQFCPVSIPRKKDRYVPSSKYLPSRAFKSVELIGEEESVCIRVEADDHLYVTNNFVVTHNTVQALMALPEGVPVIIICPSVAKYNWANHFKEWRPSFKPQVLEGKKSF
jgi:intein/homing endonuclease